MQEQSRKPRWRYFGTETLTDIVSMSAFLYETFGENWEDVLEKSKVYIKYSFGDCAYSLIRFGDFVECFNREERAKLRKSLSTLETTWPHVDVLINLAS